MGHDRFDLGAMPPHQAFSCWCGVKQDVQGVIDLDIHPQCPIHGGDGVETIRACVNALAALISDSATDEEMRRRWQQVVAKVNPRDYGFGVVMPQGVRLL